LIAFNMSRVSLSTCTCPVNIASQQVRRKHQEEVVVHHMPSTLSTTAAAAQLSCILQRCRDDQQLTPEEYVCWQLTATACCPPKIIVTAEP